MHVGSDSISLSLRHGLGLHMISEEVVEAGDLVDEGEVVHELALASLLLKIVGGA